MSNLLLKEAPLIILPSLAKLIGLNESIILQQMHYWLQKSNHQYDGFVWIYNSYADWQEQFPFWSESTIKRTIRSLEKSGVLISGNYNTMKIDKTKWYRIDYEKLNEIETDVTDHQVKMTHREGQNDLTEQAKMTRPIPETTTKTTTESKGAPEKIDYLSTLANHTPGKETVAQPDDFQQHFCYRDEFLQIYNQLLSRLPSQVEKDEIVDLAHQDGASAERWERSIREAALNWAGNSRTPPLQRIIEVYQHGGDYDKWRQWKYPDDKSDGKTTRPRLEFVNQITGEVTVYDSK